MPGTIWRRLAVRHQPADMIRMQMGQQYLVNLARLVAGRLDMPGQLAEPAAKQRAAAGIASPHFSSLPRVLQRVDAVAAVPGGLAPIWENDFGLLSAAIPLALPTIEIALVCHATRDKDVFVLWVCGVVKDLVPGLAAGSLDAKLKLSEENVQK